MPRLSTTRQKKQGCAVICAVVLPDLSPVAIKRMDEQVNFLGPTGSWNALAATTPPNRYINRRGDEGGRASTPYSRSHITARVAHCQEPGKHPGEVSVSPINQGVGALASRTASDCVS